MDACLSKEILEMFANLRLMHKNIRFARKNMKENNKTGQSVMLTGIKLFIVYRI